MIFYLYLKEDGSPLAKRKGFPRDPFRFVNVEKNSLSGKWFKDNRLHFKKKKKSLLALKAITDMVVCWPQQATIPVMASKLSKS